MLMPRRMCALLFLLAGAACAQTAALVKADPNAPQNAARTALIQSLDALAAQQTAARRARIAQIHTRVQAEARQRLVRATMLRLLGPLPEKTPLNPQILGETAFDGFRIQKILFDSQPNFHVTALLYLPAPLPAGKLPAIVMAPGHGATGKASDFAFASMFARNGFAVLSYDPIGQGERLQYPDPANPGKSLATRPTGEHAEASLQPMLLGESVAKYFLWDGIRAVDYLQTRAEIDPQRIGAFGCSGGGAMTALLAALDTRIAAAGTACYITSFDTLLPSIGPQDGEQSTPGWIAAGLDFPDWVELAAPRPYAIISTASDMFPYAGALASAAESRRFYALFDSSSAGAPVDSIDLNEKTNPITGPTLNPDTPNTVPPTAALQFIVGPGGHGNLRPLQSQILQFFLTHLKSPGAPSQSVPSIEAGSSNPKGSEAPAPTTFQVTSTGQVATAYPNSATVFSLNLAHAKALASPHLLTLPELQAEIRQLLGVHPTPVLPETQAISFLTPDTFSPSPPHPAHSRFATVLLLTSEDLKQPSEGKAFSAIQNRFYDLPEHGKAALLLGSRPSPSGTEEQKTPLLGQFYLLNLRAELSGNTLLGLRVEDVLRAVNDLAHRLDVDPANIAAEASGHEAFVLLHAAVLDPRLKHITLRNLPATYREVLADPLPKDVAEDVVPGVLLHYDIPDLIRALGSRVTVVPTDNPIPVP